MAPFYFCGTVDYCFLGPGTSSGCITGLAFMRTERPALKSLGLPHDNSGAVPRVPNFLCSLPFGHFADPLGLGICDG